MNNHVTSFSPAVVRALKDLACIEFDKPMSFFTTFKTGGIADLVVTPRRIECIPGLIAILKESDHRFIAIGGGSNLLVSDRGIRGAVLRICDSDPLKGVVTFHADDPFVYADASVKKADFISFCLENGLEGVECMAGIPGCIGGGIAMNAGTFMGSFSDILTDVDILDKNGEVKKIPVSPEMFSYRRLHLPEYVAILGGHFKLRKSADVHSAKNRVTEILKDREVKHPLEYPSAGSVFKNPEGHSSWKLINDAGLKGMRIGGASVSVKHTNFIINECNATSSDIHSLIIHVQETVERKFGIHLEPEVKMIGEF